MAEMNPKGIIILVIAVIFIAYTIPDAIGTFMTQLSNATGLSPIQVSLLSLLPLGIIAGILMKVME